MTYSERKKKEKHLLYLIEQQRLCSLEKVADDFECSKKTVKRMICSLREEGYNIAYCRTSSKYYVKN